MITDDQRRARIDAWIEGWMDKLNARAQDYRAQGLPPEDALDRAIYDIRMQIRRAPVLDLD